MNAIRTRQALWWIAGGGALGALLLFPLEAAGILEAAPQLYTADLLLAFLFSITMLGALGALFGLLWAVWLSLSEHGRMGRVLLSLFLVLPVIFVQFSLTKGAWIQQQSWLWPVFFFLVFLEVLLSYLLANLFSRLRIWLKSFSTRAIFFVCFAVLSWGVALADRSILPGLYPEAHTALATLSIMFASASGVCLAYPGQAWQFRIPAFSILLLLPIVLFSLAQRRIAWGAVARSSAVGRSTTMAAVAMGIGPKEFALSKEGSENSLLWPSSVKRPSLAGADVILITIDALRPDRLGVYGSSKNLSPNLDALAKRSAVFTRAYAPSPTSSHSLLSIFAARYAPNRLAADPGPWKTLAEHLETYGYRSYGIYNEGVFFTDKDKFFSYKKNGFGFDSYLVEYLDTYQISRLGAQFLLKERAPAFLWIHLAEPHEPYQVRPGFSRGNTPEDRYDAEVAYADYHLDQLLRYLENRNAIVIVLADHGEAFGEHGVYYHTSDVYAEQTWIPFFLFYPGMTPRTIEAPVTPVDLAPTVLDLLGLPPLQGQEGRSIAPLLVGQSPDRMPVVSTWKSRYAIAQENYRLIYDESTRSYELFDIKNDPEELQDISFQHPEIAESLLGELQAFLRKQQKPKENEFVWPEAIQRAAINGTEASEELLPYLADEKPKIRTRAAELLKNSPQFAKNLLPLLEDSVPGVRDQAALSLGNLGDARAVPQLKSLLKRKEKNLAAQAAILLGKLGMASPEEICLGLDAIDPDIQEKALQLLRKEGISLGSDRKIILKIIPFLESGPLTAIAARTLADIDAKMAVPSLIWALEHATQIPTRAAIVSALKSLQDPAATKALAKRAAFGEGGDHVGEALLAVGATPPKQAAGGPASSIVSGKPWQCKEEKCFLQKNKGKLRFMLPESLASQPYTLLLSASGTQSVSLFVKETFLGKQTLSKNNKDLRFPLKDISLQEGEILEILLQADGELQVGLGMILPVPDDPSTHYTE